LLPAAFTVRRGSTGSANCNDFPDVLDAYTLHAEIVWIPFLAEKCSGLRKAIPLSLSLLSLHGQGETPSGHMSILLPIWRLLTSSNGPAPPD
jgi:hypothetical protein